MLPPSMASMAAPTAATPTVAGTTGSSGTAGGSPGAQSAGALGSQGGHSASAAGVQSTQQATAPPTGLYAPQAYAPHMYPYFPYPPMMPAYMSPASSASMGLKPHMGGHPGAAGHAHGSSGSAATAGGPPQGAPQQAVYWNGLTAMAGPYDETALASSMAAMAPMGMAMAAAPEMGAWGYDPSAFGIAAPGGVPPQSVSPSQGPQAAALYAATPMSYGVASTAPSVGAGGRRVAAPGTTGASPTGGAPASSTAALGVQSAGSGSPAAGGAAAPGAGSTGHRGGAPGVNAQGSAASAQPFVPRSYPSWGR